ncbi:amino acid ABC transporter ATP-binding protein [Azospirillum endophyticum]
MTAGGETISKQPPHVQLTSVHLDYGTTPILKGVSLEIARSEIVAIIGPSGSGKSTILRAVNALAPIREGSIRVGGIEVNDRRLDARALRRKVGMVFQSYNLFPHRTVLQNVAMAPVDVLGENRAEVERRARALLARVRLDGKENAYPGELSGGQQQRVAIARSLCMRPEVMMFDEVTAALDPETVKEVLSAIRDVARGGMTCILVTHEMRFAREVADTIVFIDRGEILARGSADTFFNDPGHPRAAEFLAQVL